MFVCVCPRAGGTCLGYEWVTDEWKDNQRAVWCQRSDGVNVTGSNTIWTLFKYPIAPVLRHLFH